MQREFEYRCAVEWKSPFQWYPDEDSLVEAAFAKFIERDRRKGRKSADLHTGEKAARHFKGRAPILGKIPARMHIEVQAIPRRRIVCGHVASQNPIFSEAEEPLETALSHIVCVYTQCEPRIVRPPQHLTANS